MSLLLLALALSMDVFAAALSRGVSANSGSVLRTAVVVGLALGAAQGLMPILGWSLSTALASLFRDLDHWVAFVLLVLIGLHMVKEGRGRRARGGGRENGGASLVVVALATSVDAAAAGATLTGLQQSVAVACASLGLAGFLFAAAGVALGKAAGDAIGPRAQMVGGIVLIGLGVKIVIEHEFFGG